ncbi:MAG: hypothetical protein GXY92_01600 [Syntrophomonadaceae bacterium]|nr:hypothetical protein [Syntrophomonadaceae bacterium]
MSRAGNPRVLLWVLVLALVAYVAYLYIAQGDNNASLPQKPPAVSQATIISDFRELKDIQVPTEAELGGQFYATELLFPEGFKGEAGDVFYVRMEDGHILTTISYRIEEVTKDVPARATYIPLEDLGPQFEPEGEYTVKNITQQEIAPADSE